MYRVHEEPNEDKLFALQGVISKFGHKINFKDRKSISDSLNQLLEDVKSNFVAETKGSENDNDLRAIESLKIHCAKEHFKTISGGEVKFDVIKTYSKLLDIAALK